MLTFKLKMFYLGNRQPSIEIDPSKAASNLFDYNIK